MPGTVLVLTHQFDPMADLVVEELSRRGVPLFRCDLAQFPMEVTATAELTPESWSGELRLTDRAVRLDEVCGVYYRRPTGFRFEETMSAEERRWASVQARLGFGGLLASMEVWLNHPHVIGFAEYKPVQLDAARRCGLSVPRTLVTNDPVDARAFVASLARAVCKPFGANSFVDTDGVQQLFCSSITSDQVTDSVASTMHLFQEWVPKAHEIRLTVVDDVMFGARIDAGSAEGHQDWRADYRNLTYSVATVPDSVRSSVLRLLRQMRLRFAALDFVVDHDDRWWFIDLNPNGQWGWIEDEIGVPIAGAIASALEVPA